MRKTLVCPECGSAINHGVQIVSNDNPPFERFKCDACGREGITEDLVLKRDFAKFSAAHPHGHIRGAGGGSLTSVPNGFPHMWRYTYTRGSGDAIITSPNVFDTTLVAGISRWHATTINISPFSDSDLPVYNTVYSQLRTLNPSIKIYSYNTCSFLTQNLGPNPTSFVREAWLLATVPNRRFYCVLDAGVGFPHDGTLPGSDLVGVAFDLSAVGPTAYANIWKKYGGFGDGYWFDYFIAPVADYILNAGHDLDYALAGYGSKSAVNTAETTALTSFATAMQSDPKLKVGNSGGYTSLAIHQTPTPAGELLENWPTGVPGNFDTNMTRALAYQGTDPTGDGTAFLAKYDSVTQGQPTFWSQARFTLGSACVAGGMGYVGNLGITYGASTGLGTLVNHDMNIWADEYTVDSTGTSDGTGTVAANRGWLGRPTAFGFKHASGCWVREFTNGIVIVNGSGSTINHPLTGTWRRLRGVFDTTVNNGATVSGTVSVPTSDARFLLRA